MELQTLILLITISLLISNVNAGSCTAAADGVCCRLSGADSQGKGVQTCGTQATDGQDMFATACLQGYYLAGTSPSLTCTLCVAGQTAGDATNGSTATSCTDCAANTYCPLGTAGTANIAPSACPTGSTSAAASDNLNDCICTLETQTLDTSAATVANACVTTYTGAGGQCRTFALGTSATTCTLCRDGYQISNNVCVACEANCATCSTSQCLTPNPQFFLNGSNVPTACQANCDVCTSATACTDASVGYYLNASNVPTACAANCDQCTATACTAASKGYYLNASSAVTQCPTNCTWCTFASNAVTCTGVAANYFVLTTATGVATACAAGTSSLATPAGQTATPAATPAAGCTITCSTNCQNCAVNGAAKCDSCNNDFILDATLMTCTALTETTRHVSCLTARGITAADCVTCRDADNRTLVKATETAVTGTCSCQPTFTESGQTDAVKFPTLAERSACVACGKGVATCQTASDAKPLEPLTCTDKTQLIVGNICAATTDKIDFVYYDSTDQQFVPCDDSCQSCAAKGPGACVVCQDLPAVSGLEQTDEATLLKAWTNGTLPATGGTCYSQCPTGYGIEDETRVNCVQSSTQIISMIAVFISFIFLI